MERAGSVCYPNKLIEPVHLLFRRSFMLKHFGAVVCFLVVIAVSSSSGMDMNGKFGMGIRVVGSPIITFSAIRIGTSSNLSLEPGIGYYQYRTSSEYESGVDLNGQPIMGTDKYTNSLFLISNLFNITVVKRERSNLLIRLGGSYGYISSKVESADPYSGASDNSAWNFSLQGGFGIEHFFTDHFSAYAGILCGYVLEQSDNGSSDQFQLIGFGNQLADFSLIWYL
jgi:hypothetical protein